MTKRKPRGTPGDKSICLPISDGIDYNALVENRERYRAYLEQQIAQHPELFPVEISSGYRFHGFVTSVRQVPQGELEELLKPWLGEGAASDNVPIPALIDVELNREANEAEIASLQSALDEAAPGTRIDAQSEWLRPVYDALSAVQYLVLALIALVGLATAAAVWLNLPSHVKTIVDIPIPSCFTTANKFALKGIALMSISRKR